MAVNAGIYNALMQPVRSVADYSAEYDAADARKQGLQRNALLMMQAQQQMQEQQRQAAAQQQAAAQAEQQRQARDAALQRMQSVRGINANAASGVTGPRPEAAAVIGQQPQIDAAELLRLGFKKEEIEFLANRGTLGMPEVARTIEGAGTGNMPQTTQFDKFGRPVGSAIPKAVEMKMADLGGNTQVYNPFALTPGQSFEKTQTKDSIASNARMASDAAASRAQSDRHFNTRLGYDQQKDAAKAEAPPKPLPPAALKMQQESLDAIGVASSINADLGSVRKQITDGKLKFGPISNMANAGLNLAGMSTQESRNFSSFKSTLERLRNESLRLNTGVQTDGDAQRAWNELFQNINDTKLVEQRLNEIEGINKRGAELHRLRVDSVRGNYGAPALDSSAYGKQPAAVGTSGKTVKRTGTSNGRKVVEYSDGSIEYAD